MPAISDLEIGLFFWAEPDARATLVNVLSTGVTSGQLAIDGTVKLTPETAAEWKAALAEADFHLFTVFAAYEGENYADIPTVERTVGFIPKATRAEREVRTREVIDLAAALGVKSFGCHVGYIPHDKSHPDYIDVRDMVRRIADYAATHGMSYCLETGQEPAGQLLEFFKDVDRSNVKINFDPANMILYGSGEPIEAFKLLRPHVISVHGKDGDWPDPAKPGSLGTERPLGEGSVNIAKFFATLRETGYTGPVCIESGVHGEAQRWEALKRDVELLKSVRG
ncbi:MAG: sugar phosphate isomerase/epimerase [Bryobacteraceae bacterium]|nr:sugar phosphate isomerase/epimerase [Bryobacteraceae bacterium]